MICFIAAVMACCLVILAISGPALASASSQAPTARRAADEMGKGFNRGQMFDAGQHPPTLEAARGKIDAYYDRGFRVVRG